MLTVKELATRFKLSERTIYNYIKKGAIPFTRIGGQYRFDEEEIKEWAKTSTKSAKSKLEIIKDIGNPLEKRLYFIALLTKELKAQGVRPILVGGNAVELYTAGGYATADIDLVAPTKPVGAVLRQWNFNKVGRYWVNKELDLQVEAPADRLAGDCGRLTQVLIEDLEVFVIGIEDIIVDRLNAYVHWKSNDDRFWAEEMADIGKDRIDWDYLDKRCREEGTLDALKQIKAEVGAK